MRYLCNVVSSFPCLTPTCLKWIQWLWSYWKLPSRSRVSWAWSMCFCRAFRDDSVSICGRRSKSGVFPTQRSNPAGINYELLTVIGVNLRLPEQSCLAQVWPPFPCPPGREWNKVHLGLRPEKHSHSLRKSNNPLYTYMYCSCDVNSDM